MSRNLSDSRPSGGSAPSNEQWLPLLVVVAAATLQLLPHPHNMAPLGALALFAGAYLDRRLFLLAPLGTLLLSDLANGFYHAVVMLSVYLGFALSAAAGRWLLHRRDRVERIVLAWGVGALAFYLVSNAGSWLAFRPLTAAGLLQCYVDGLPYLARSLMGDAMYATLLFGGYRLLRRAPLRRAAPAH